MLPGADCASTCRPLPLPRMPIYEGPIHRAHGRYAVQAAQVIGPGSGEREIRRPLFLIGPILLISRKRHILGQQTDSLLVAHRGTRGCRGRGGGALLPASRACNSFTYSNEQFCCSILRPPVLAREVVVAQSPPRGAAAMSSGGLHWRADPNPRGDPLDLLVYTWFPIPVIPD